MTERPENFYSEGAEKFAQDYSLENMPEAYIDLLEKFIELTDGQKVLDAGCGTGRDTEYFQDKGFEAVGIDLAEGMIEHAKENKEGLFYRMDIKDLDFENGEFSGVWANTVIQFFPPEQMPEIIDELKRALKPGGTFYISFKIGEGTVNREAYGSEVKQYLIPEEKARKMLEDKGLEIKEVKNAEVNETGIMNVITELNR